MPARKTKTSSRSRTSDGPNHGTFVKDGKERTAASRGAAVRMRFEGWEEVQPASPEALEPIEAVTTES